MSVMLGFKDEAVKTKDFVDWSCNKFGGKADWMINCASEMIVQPQCKKCGNPMYLLVQIYCPLVNSVYHRTLYVYGCSQTGCWNDPESFSVIRCQKKEVKEKEQKETKIETDDWGTNDWGANETDDNKEEDEKQEDENTGGDVSQEELSMDDLIQKMSQSLSISTSTTSKLQNTPPHSFVPYHIYVMNEKDAVRESSVTSNDYEMQLYQEYVDREGELQANHQNNNNKSSGKNKTSRGSTDGDCHYEKTKVKHGDSAFYQFSKQIRPCPQQCLRYDWQGTPLILSDCSKITPPLNAIPPCQKCGAVRVFEMQLMPNLVTCLHKTKITIGSNSKQHSSATNGHHELNSLATNGHHIDKEDEITWTAHAQAGMSIDFGCLYIFTCSQSCWRDNDDVICLEVVAMQPDPETAVLS
eukprot:TCONS_00049568-protein